MTEIETEVKLEKNKETKLDRNVNVFSSRVFSDSTSEDLKTFDTYKPTDLNELFGKLAKKTEEKQVEKYETDLDRLTKLDDEDCPVVLSKTVEVDEPQPVLKLNVKGKLVVFVVSVFLVLLSFLAIYNAFFIKNLNNSIESLNKEIEAGEIVLNDKIEKYNLLTGDGLLLSEAAESGFSQIDAENIHTIEIEQVNSNSPVSEQSNWFDAFCTWIAGLFGA